MKRARGRGGTRTLALTKTRSIGESHAMATSHSIVEPFPDHIDREAFGHWLSGFIDGEAHFGLFVDPAKKGHNLPSYRTPFRLSLRDDDIAILRLIQSFWHCGTIKFGANANPTAPNSKPIAYYSVHGLKDLKGILIPHFERYPLRAKKANDYILWKQGVELRCRVQQQPKP